MTSSHLSRMRYLTKRTPKRATVPSCLCLCPPRCPVSVTPQRTPTARLARAGSTWTQIPRPEQQHHLRAHVAVQPRKSRPPPSPAEWPVRGTRESLPFLTLAGQQTPQTTKCPGFHIKCKAWESFNLSKLPSRHHRSTQKQTWRK